MARVNPAILVWARETAGLTPAEAAQRLGMRDTARATAVEKLAKLEGAAEAPLPLSRSMLLKMSKLYRRPLLTFYLSHAPAKGVRGQDFRMLPPDHAESDEALVDALVREIRARQSIVRDVMEAEDEAQPHWFIGRIALNNGVPAAVALLSDVLKMSRSEYRGAPSADEAFKRLRKHAEAAGIFVVLQGDLGHHRSQISVETFRGFALADSVAPFVVINDQDTPTAWSFTLLHEIVHLCLGATGISGGRPEGALEQFCNEAASAYLVDEAELQLLRVTDLTLQDTARRQITDFARPRHLSSTMVAYRLFRTGAISYEYWNELRLFYRQMWLNAKASQRERAREDEGGPSYYVVRRHRVGDALIVFTRRMMADGALSTTKAARVLAVKPQGVGPLLAA
jgi:Zn-dependent peptidase ImmA (M78 family)